MTGNVPLTISFLRTDLDRYEQFYRYWLNGEIDDQDLERAARSHLHWDSNGLGIVATLRSRATQSVEWDQLQQDWVRMVMVHSKALDTMAAIESKNRHLGCDSISNMRGLYAQFSNGMTHNQIGMIKQILGMD